MKVFLQVCNGQRGGMVIAKSVVDDSAIFFGDINVQLNQTTFFTKAAAVSFTARKSKMGTPNVHVLSE